MTAADSFRLLNHLPIGACVATADLRVVFWNVRLQEWTGLSPEDMVDAPLTHRFPHLAKPRYGKRIARVAHGGPPATFSAQLHGSLLTCLGPDGRERKQNATVSRLVRDDGDPLVLISIEDVTDAVKRTQAFQDMRAQALRELEARKVVQSELARSNRDLADFAGIVSHDLQAPARQAKRFAELLLASHSDQLDESGRTLLAHLTTCASRMESLVRDVLAYSKITTDQDDRELVDLGVVAEGVLQDLRSRIREYEGSVEVGALPNVVAQPTQMRQLLLNLISNALKFHRPQAPPRVQLKASTSTDLKHWVIEVVDNGIGIPANKRNSIFGMFQRLHNASEYEGTGVGLAVCKKIVERHGGTIVACDNADEPGTCVRIELPAATSSSTLRAS